MNKRVAKIMLFCLVFILGIVLFRAELKAEMSSDSYTILADVISVGGDYSAGGNYTMEDTLGETPVGVVSTTTYILKGGYQYMETGSLSISIDDTSLSLGTLSVSEVSAASSTITISTDSATGYSLSISGLSGTALTSVTDNEVTAGSEEYGLAVSGVDSQVSLDVAIVDSLLLSSSSTAVTASESILTFKAARSSITTAGNYSQAIIVTASGNI